jgi:hypothetical protein
MKIELEIDEEEIKKELVQIIARSLSYKIDSKIQDKIFASIDWSKMGSHVQEALLKMAAEQLFKR